VFVAWRDLRFAKGRFALMGTVIVLITLLVGLLSGLTTGLGRENTSAITGLNADHLTFAAPATNRGISFTDSRIGQATWQQWAGVPGVTSAQPVGISMARAQADAGVATLSAFGIPIGSDLTAGGPAIKDGSVVLSQQAATELRVRVGDTITLQGRTELVAAVEGEAMYSHTPVVWMSFSDWQQLTSSDDADNPATVVALTTTSAADVSAADQRLGTATRSTKASLQAIGSYSSENGSLQLMRGLLFAISALVIGAFFTVWTIQRSGDVAVLKALGASTRYLLKDALGQALILLVIGTGIGTAAAGGIGAALGGGTVPFVLGASIVLVPMLVMIALGALGAALSIRRITSVDPLTALGSAR
jgi:putative ABC transport system permease protein